MPANSFRFRELRTTLILAGTNQVFPGTNSNTLRLTNLRVSAEVQSVARLSTQLSMRIYGMLQADMNALTVAWANPPVVLDHIAIIEARANDGTLGPNDGWTQVFRGTIIEAQPDYTNAPDVQFTLLARIGYFQQINPAEPTAYQETVDIGLVAGDLADAMGFKLQNGGVNTVLNGPLYLHGTLYDQLATACQMAQADFYFLGDTILITPVGQPRGKQPAVVLNKDTGLIGYPVYERSGLRVRALFDPAFLCGTPIELTSIVPNATGRWYPYALTHSLESRVPNGKWETEMQCLRVLV